MTAKLDVLLRMVAAVNTETAAWHTGKGFKCTRCDGFCGLYPEGFCSCCKDAFFAAAILDEPT